VQGLYLDNHTKTAKVLDKKLLDQKRCTFFQDASPIRFMLPMVDIILFFPRRRDEILTTGDRVLRARFIVDIYIKLELPYYWLKSC